MKKHHGGSGEWEHETLAEHHEKNVHSISDEGMKKAIDVEHHPAAFKINSVHEPLGMEADHKHSVHHYSEHGGEK